jgi:hypothetical protein
LLASAENLRTVPSPPAPDWQAGLRAYSFEVTCSSRPQYPHASKF